MADADIDDVLLGGSDMTPRSRRRQVIGQLVRALSDIIHRLDGQEERSQASIVRLTATLQAMTDSIATADDITFSAIMREAALLIRTLKHRQTDFTPFTIH